MGNRNDGYVFACAGFRSELIDGENNCARPILSAFDLPPFLFFLPKI